VRCGRGRLSDGQAGRLTRNLGFGPAVRGLMRNRACAVLPPAQESSRRGCEFWATSGATRNDPRFQKPYAGGGPGWTHMKEPICLVHSADRVG